MPKDIGKEFLEKSMLRNLTPSAQSAGAKQPALQHEEPSDRTVIDLPPPTNIEVGDYPLRKAIEERRSIRSFATTPLSKEELAYLLWCTQGAQKIERKRYGPTEEVVRAVRTVPSAGGRHAFDTYVMATNVTSVPPGLYWYDALEHRLVERMTGQDLASQIASRCAGQTWMERAGAIFIWVADVYRMNWRYCERGYRYMFLDAGHVCQNLYLASESIGCGACAIGAYDDDAMNDFLEVDGESRFVIYAGTVGKKMA